MNSSLTRRRFLEQSALLGAGLAATAVLPRLRAVESSANKVRIGVMGLGRGLRFMDTVMDLPGVEVAYVCDPDRHRVEEGLATVKKKQSSAVKGVQDFRRILDDSSVDAVVIATPHFWLTPATMLACAAGQTRLRRKAGESDSAGSRMDCRGRAQTPASCPDGQSAALCAVDRRGDPEGA